MGDMPRVIIIQGTPGTGKTTICRIISKKLNARHIDISKLVIKEKLYYETDEKRPTTKVTDIKRTRQRLMEIIKNTTKPLIIEGHYADIVPSNQISNVIILRLHPRILERRLRRRGWPEDKIKENVMAEVLDQCLINAIQAYGENKIIEIDLTNKGIKNSIEEVMNAIEGRINPNIGNWFKELEKEGELDKFLKEYSSTKTQE